MKRIEEETYISAVAAFEFPADGEPVYLFGYGWSTRSVVPVKAEAEWGMTDGVWTLEHVIVRGYPVRASGEVARNQQSRTAYRCKAYAPGDTAGWADDAPQTLKDAVAEYGISLTGLVREGEQS